MGLNLFMRIVVFLGYCKYDGYFFCNFFFGEYIQMVGWVGRCGFDIVGFVIIVFFGGDEVFFVIDFW